MPDAFTQNDKKRVPLVYQHLHHSIDNVLGYVDLEKRPDGVYAYGFFNESDAGKTAKAAVAHGDLTMMSIWANELVKRGDNVHGGDIKEVSLVLAGANKGARIENVYIQHGETDTIVEEEFILHTGIPIELEHAAAGSLQEAWDGVPEQYKQVFYAMADELVTAAGGASVQHSDDEGDSSDSEDSDADGTEEEDDTSDSEDDANDSDEEDDSSDSEDDDANSGDDESIQHQEGPVIMTRVFEQNKSAVELAKETLNNDALRHSALNKLASSYSEAVKAGKNPTWKEFLAHSEDILAHAEGDYGITNIEELFPDAKFANGATPQWITRRMEWVDEVLNSARKLPYARIKSRSADLTHEEARAKGYIKGEVKKEQFFAIQGRETTPKTIYKKQKLDRDDIIDITEFNVVAWIWVEMRFMLREEIARAVLIGDGREVDDPDKIDESKIRPIAFDDPFYTVVVPIASTVVKDDLVDAVLSAREDYDGGSNPTGFMTRKTLNEILLAKDTLGRRLYANRGEVASAMELDSIVTVGILDGVNHDAGDLLMILVNMGDYSIGTDQGGEITTFDDFDIDVNQYKYLIEGRMSGALTEHRTAQVIVRANSSETLVTPADPTFVKSTGVLTVPSTAHVVYKNADTGATLSSGAQTAIASGATVNVTADPAAGYFFPHGFDNNWSFTRD
jgi:hypothetical protein